MDGGSYTEIAGGKITEVYEDDYNMYADGNIITTASKSINEVGEDNGVSYNSPQTAATKEATDFDIKIELIKNNKTFLPLGIADFNGKIENDKLKFKITITGKGVNHWQWDIKNFENIIYTAYSNSDEMEEVVVVSKKSNKAANTPKPTENIPPERFWPAGEYTIEWDGFDSNGIYISKRFLENNLISSIRGNADGFQKYFESDPMKFQASEVDWVDVIVNKNVKTIQAILRLNLTDGGTIGLDAKKWNKIPDSTISKIGKPIITTRTKSYNELLQLTLGGLTYHWGRNENHAEAKYITINNDQYQIYVLPQNTSENGIASPEIIFNTNNELQRSRNWELSRKLFYNIGYQLYSDGWGYIHEGYANNDFKYTGAHEIGHEIIKAYGGHLYSKEHEASASILQNVLSTQPNYPVSGEINLMQYFQNYPSLSAMPRVVAIEKDVIGLIWCSKIKINE